MEITDMNWRKASYSNGGENACVEVANTPGAVLVRDTKQSARTGRTTLAVTPEAWRLFTVKLAPAALTRLDR